MSDDRPDWCKGQVQLKYEGQMAEDVVDWNKIVMAFDAGAPELENDYPDWVKGTVYEEGSTAGACCIVENLKQIFDIGAKTLDYTEYNTVALTAEEANITGVKIECEFQEIAAASYLNVEIFDASDNPIGWTDIYVDGTPSEHVVSMVVTFDAYLTVQFLDYPKGILKVDGFHCFQRDLGAGDQAFKLTAVGGIPISQVSMKVWIKYEDTRRYAFTESIR